MMKLILIALTMCTFGLFGMFCIDFFYWWPSVAKKKKMADMNPLASIGALICFAAFCIGIGMLCFHHSEMCIFLETPKLVLAGSIALIVILYGGFYPIFKICFGKEPVEAGPFWDQGWFKWITLIAEGGGFLIYGLLLTCVALQIRKQHPPTQSLPLYQNQIPIRRG